jgi:uncharacterized protein YbbC (DUF1343 family)
MAVNYGIDSFLGQFERYGAERIGLVTNHASVTKDYIPTRLALVRAGFSVIRLFSPEHGLDVVGADGVLMRDGYDELTGLVIVSLYGEKLIPSFKDFEDLDLIVLDLPDVGCRFYTYLWTLTYVMEACSLHRKPLVVLDRPNPLSGAISLMEGPVLREECASFLGRWELPLRHAYTFGELARFWQHERLPDLVLQISQVSGWKRKDFLDDWESSFVPTSPAITDFHAALVYPGLGLLEATNLSEGRGTATPFRIAGAPWLNATAITETFNQQGLSGVWARSIIFTPTAGKYQYEICKGVMFHVVDKTIFRPVETMMRFIKLVKDLHASEFCWALYPTHVNADGTGHLDKLLGVPNSEKLFDLPWDAFLVSLSGLVSCGSWSNKIEQFLLYH